MGLPGILSGVRSVSLIFLLILIGVSDITRGLTEAEEVDEPDRKEMLLEKLRKFYKK